jgi:hypothetical protein
MGDLDRLFWSPDASPPPAVEAAKDAYVAGEIGLDTLEDRVERALTGGAGRGNGESVPDYDGVVVHQ